MRRKTSPSLNPSPKEREKKRVLIRTRFLNLCISPLLGGGAGVGLNLNYRHDGEAVDFAVEVSLASGAKLNFTFF